MIITRTLGAIMDRVILAADTVRAKIAFRRIAREREAVRRAQMIAELRRRVAEYDAKHGAPRRGGMHNGKR